MIRLSEFQILVQAVAIAPFLVWAYRGIDLPEKPWMGAGAVAILGAYVATVAEGFFAYTAFNLIEHVLYAVCGACFLAATVRRAVRIAGDKT